MATTAEPTARTAPAPAGPAPDPRFAAHTPDTAPGKAGELLGQLWERHGGPVGEMVRTMAGSPAVLAGYLDLSRATKRVALRREVTERISLAIQQRIGCELCLAAHTAAARAAGVEADEIMAARLGTSADPRLAAIVGFAVRLHAAPSTVDTATIDDLRRIGWSDREILEVVSVVTLNLLTGTFNLIAGLEPEHTSTDGTSAVTTNEGAPS